MESHPMVSIDFWGDPFSEMRKIPRIINRGFLENTVYKTSIRDAGYIFGIVPLGGFEEDPETLFFNSCKSCIKYIDYSSLGIPGIYSESPVYLNAISHMKTGYLVKNNTKSWLDAMNNLFENSSLRNQFRICAYEDSIKNFGISSSADIFLKIFLNN